MGTTAQKLQNIVNAKASISAAIEAKGGTVPSELTGYGAAIQALPSGGSSDLAAKIVDGSVTEITAADLSGATKINQYGLYRCGNLTSVSLPDSVTAIEQYAFRYCSALSSVSFGNALTVIGNYGFGNSGLTSISIPDSVVSVSNYLFYQNTQMVSATLGNGVSSIGNQMFFGCSNLSNVYFKDDRQIIPTLAAPNAFTNLPTDYKIWVPSALYDAWITSGNWSNSAVQPHIWYEGLDRLNQTYVKYTDNSIRYLDITGTLAASDIPNLNTVKELRIGKGVTSLGSTSLTAAWRTMTDLSVPNTITAIPNSFCKAGDFQGRGPTALSSVVLPDTIVTIESEAFRGCVLTSFTFPTNTTSIGNYCFSYSHQLKEVHINAALNSLGSQVFGSTEALSSITVDENNQSFKTENGMLLNKSGTELWKIPPAMSNGNIVVQEGVTKLKFDSCNFLSCSSLTLPTTLTTIEQAVFNGSSFSTPPTIPSSVTSIANQYWDFPIAFANRTMAQVQGMSGYPWGWAAGAQYICTDGTITR